VRPSPFASEVVSGEQCRVSGEVERHLPLDEEEVIASLIHISFVVVTETRCIAFEGLSSRSPDEAANHPFDEEVASPSNAAEASQPSASAEGTRLACVAATFYAVGTRHCISSLAGANRCTSSSAAEYLSSPSSFAGSATRHHSPSRCHHHSSSDRSSSPCRSLIPSSRPPSSPHAELPAASARSGGTSSYLP